MDLYLYQDALTFSVASRHHDCDGDFALHQLVFFPELTTGLTGYLTQKETYLYKILLKYKRILLHCIMSFYIV
jgi:hypothetical protein